MQTRDEVEGLHNIWSGYTGQWLSCFWQLSIDHIWTILWMSYIKDADLPRHSWDTPPFLLIVDAYVCTYVRLVNYVTTKRKEDDHIPWVWGSVPRALRALGSPAMNTYTHPLCDFPRRGAPASLRHRNRAATTIFVCKQKSYPVCSSWRRKSYPV